MAEAHQRFAADMKVLFNNGTVLQVAPARLGVLRIYTPLHQWAALTL